MTARHSNNAGRSPTRLATALLALVACCLVSCAPPSRPLRIGTNDFPGYELLYLARDMGFFGKARIELLEFPSTTEVIRAYRNGAIDVAAMTADEALLAAERDQAEHIVLVTDASAGADAIVAKPSFPSMQALRGRRIGVETGALGSLVLSRALELNGMSPSDVTVVPLTLDVHESGYRQNVVDAVVTFDPTSSALETAGAVRVFDSTQMAHEIFDVLLASDPVVQSRREELAALARGWFRAQRHLKDKREDALQRMASRVKGRSVEGIGQSLDRLEIPDGGKLLQWLGQGPDSLDVSLKSLSDFMIREDLLPRHETRRLILDDRIVKDAIT